MKIASLTCIVIGLLAALMAGLTALSVSPGFVDFGLYDTVSGAGLGDITGIDTFKSVTTTAFWGGLSLLLLLAAIAFSAIAEKE